MQSSTIDIDQLMNGLSSGNIQPHNIYNADLQLSSILSAEYYKSHRNDNVDRDQKMSTVFIDIEVYTRNAPNQRFDFKTGDCPLSAVTIYSTTSKRYFMYILLNSINTAAFGVSAATNLEEYSTQLVAQFKKELIESKHIENEELHIMIFNDEMAMIKTVWNQIKIENPLNISGWNSDLFDLPYMYSRIVFISDKETATEIMSELGYVELNNGLLKIADYSNMDILRAYKPRSEGGMNYGKMLSSYSLNHVSDTELGLKKYEFDGDLDTLYEKQPIKYLLYNMVDVALCVLLNRKLKHLDLHNGIRRRVKSSFTHAMIGSSALFETFLYYTLLEDGKLVRCRMGKESQRSISEDELRHLPKFNPGKKKGVIEPTQITKAEFTALSCKFDGAYVTESTPRILKDNALIIDMDAVSLYPSMILQHNISFDSFQLRVIPTTCYTLLKMLEKSVGKERAPDQIVINTIGDLISKYVDREDVTPKAKTAKNLFYSIVRMIFDLYDSNFSMSEIYEGKTDKARTIFMQSLTPLLNMFNSIHPDRESYNDFIYDKIFGEDNMHLTKYDRVYLLVDASSCKQRIICVPPVEACEIIGKFSMTLSGVGLKKHEDGLGIFTEILQNLTVLRAEYRKKAASFPEGSEQSILFDNRQKAIKVLMNSTYGIYGLSSFKYSNHWLAQAITTQGRTTIKLAQYIADKNIEYKTGTMQ